MKAKFIVKPNAKTTKLLGYDPDRKAYRVEIKSKPDKGEANKELEKFLSKHFKKKVKIISGHKSRVKMIEILS
jgi:uncharacterized protein